MAKIKFYEKSHKYKYGREELISATSFLKEFFEPFDSKGLARKISKGFKYRNRQKELKGIEVDSLTRQKQTMRYWLNEWKGKAEQGTFVHNYLEKYCNRQLTEGDWEGEIAEAEPLCRNKIKKGIEWFDNWMRSRDEPFLLPEQIIYNLDLGLAGTIDLIVMENEGRDNPEQVVTLIDWKTNTDFHKNYNKLYAKEPIQHLEDTKYSKYQLQLSLYAYMIEQSEEFDVSIKELILVEIGEDKVIEHKIKYLKKEIEDLIKWKRNKQNK